MANVSVDYFYDNDSLDDYLTYEGATFESTRQLWNRKDTSTIKAAMFEVPEVSEDWLIENKVICATVGDDEVVINPCLKEYQFFKQFDAYSAYMELDHWISGTLSFPQNAMIELDDKYRVQAHGFDHKYAFRKEPTKRKIK